jgi:hypothetical protein
MNFALRIYRRLAEAFPHEFKLVYGADIMQLGQDVVEDDCQAAWSRRADPADRGHRDTRAWWNT